MSTFALVVSCLLVAGAQSVPIYTYNVPLVAPAVHHTVIQPAVRTSVHTTEHRTVVQPSAVQTAAVFHHAPAAVVHHAPAAVVHHAPATVVHTAPAAAVVHQPVHHVLRPAVVAQHDELVYTPHHEHGYSVHETKVTHPRSSVVEHHPLTGLPHSQTDYHHAPVVTGSRSSVYHSRPATLVQRTRHFLV
ncbi:uncharacterized protein LOC144139332 [Haemaphysalis longicornis]